MKNFESLPQNHPDSLKSTSDRPQSPYGEPIPHPVYGLPPNSKNAREAYFEKISNDRIEAGETLVKELLARLSEGTTLADLGEGGIHIEQCLEKLRAERGHGGGDSIMKLAKLNKAIKELGSTSLH